VIPVTNIDPVAYEKFAITQAIRERRIDAPQDFHNSLGLSA
jgi:hypothetical protein